LSGHARQPVAVTPGVARPTCDSAGLSGREPAPHSPGRTSRPGHTGRRRGRPCAPARGTVLIVTLGIIVVLATLVLVLARSMRVEAVCSANRLAAQQAAAVEQGAIQYVLAAVDGLDGRVPADDDLLSTGARVGDGAFWILRPDPDEDQAVSYGLTDEAGKINLNSATEEMLAKLTDMTAGVPAAIIDWRDADSEVTAGGAESEYYLLLSDPYECKNAPLETVEELLLVRLASRELLFGEDANRNGVLDANEDDADASDPPDNRDGHLDHGIFDLVTVYSREPEGADEGEKKVNVNQAKTKELAKVLAEAVSEDRLPEVLLRARQGRPFQNILDFYFRTGLTSEEFHAIADRITTRGGKATTGLVNINTASSEALLCLPTLEEADVAALVAGRTDDETDPGTIAWVADVLPQEKAIAIGSHITVRSYQFSADIVSASGDGRAFRRCRIVVDASESPPRVVYRQDLTHLGWPLSPDILSLLRSGAGLDEVLEATYQEVL